MFFFLKIKYGYFIIEPHTPIIDTDKCSVTNNTLTLEWHMNENDTSQIDGFTIDVDDGMNGDFQNVHQTEDLFCTLGGLQFRSTYRARVRAFNSTGEGSYSDVVYLTTPEGETETSYK